MLIATFLFIGLILIQSIIYYEPLSLKLSLISSIEGEKIENNQVYLAGEVDTEVNYLTFRVLTPYISSLPKGKILLNGKEVSDFTKLQTTINVEVEDKITIDISAYQLDLQFKIIPSGEKIKIPQELINVKAGQKATFTVLAMD